MRKGKSRKFNGDKENQEEVKESKNTKGIRGKSSRKRNPGYDNETSDKIPMPASLKNYSDHGNPNWYFTDAMLAEQASRFSFQSFIGNGELTGSAKMPSIMSYFFNPCIGTVSRDNLETTAVNLAARKLYSVLSNKSGRTAAYGPQDVIMAVLGVGEIVSMVSWMQRAFGLVMTYSQRNRDLPRNIFGAMCINYDDFVSNIANYRVKLNTVIQTFNKIAIPANISWFQKAAAMYEAIYMDSPDEMAQLYVYNPATTWILNESVYEQGTILQSNSWCCDRVSNAPVVQTFSTYLNKLQGMVNALLTSTTLNVVYADVINYCNNNNVPMLKLGLIDETYSVKPVYDEEALLHIHNMTILGAPKVVTDTESINLEDTSAVLATPYNEVYPVVGTNAVAQYLVIAMALSTELERGEYGEVEACDLLDFPYGNPDLTQRIEASRFSVRVSKDMSKPVVTSGGTYNGLVYDIITVPDHYCVLAAAYTNGALVLGHSQLQTICASANATASNASVFDKFRYHPIMYVRKADETDIDFVLGDLNYFTHINGEWLKNLNNVCYQGLFELR